MELTQETMERMKETLKEISSTLGWDPSLMLLIACQLTIENIEEGLRNIDSRGADITIATMNNIIETLDQYFKNWTTPGMPKVMALSQLLSITIINLAKENANVHK